MCVMRRNPSTISCSGAANLSFWYVLVGVARKTQDAWGKLLDRLECLRPLVTSVPKATQLLESAHFCEYISVADFRTAQMGEGTGLPHLCYSYLWECFFFFSCVFW